MLVRTCREFRAAITAKYRPADNSQLKMSFLLVRASAIFEAASRAQLAAISYVKSPHLGLADLRLLPAHLVPRVGLQERQDVPNTGMDSLAALYGAGKISIPSFSSNHLDVVAGSLGVGLKELLRADLDGDGIEEILVHRIIYAVKGTFRNYQIGLLRRAEPGARFSFEDWPPNDGWGDAQMDLHVARATR